MHHALSDAYPRLSHWDQLQDLGDWTLFRLTGHSYQDVPVKSWTVRHVHNHVIDAFSGVRPFFGFDFAEAIEQSGLKRARSAVPVFDCGHVKSLEDLHAKLRSFETNAGLIRSWSWPRRGRHHAYLVEL